jgi:hypothetical protein
MTPVSLRMTVFRWFALALAVLALNVSLSFTNIWPTLGIRASSAVSLELAAVVLGLLIARRVGRIGSSGLRWLSIAWVVLVLGRYIDVTSRSLFGRDVNLYWDLRHLRNVGAMFAVVADAWLSVAFLGGVLLLPVGLYLVARWAFGRISEATNDPWAQRLLGVAAVGVLVLAGARGISGGAEPLAALTFADPVTPVYARELGELAYEMSGAGLRTLDPPPPIQSDFSRVAGADVLLIFLESYGAVSWDNPEFAAELAASRQLFDDAIRDTDRSVRTAFVEATTFGGESWLSHITLLSGTEVRDQGTNVRLMAQERDTLVKAFGRSGYRTVGIMPGMQVAWPEGAFYGFDTIYDLARLDYNGPPFGWWSITDQFTLARMDEQEVAPHDRRPVFVVFPTITTHAPFSPIPPYQPDWARVLTPDPFNRDELDRAWNDYPNWMNLGPSYVKGLKYAYETISGYLRFRADRDLVLILLGDHQPPSLVSGEGAGWEVPVHVIASRPSLLERLGRHGFRRGLTPSHPSVARMDGLLPILLDAFGETGEAAVVGGAGAARRE